MQRGEGGRDRDGVGFEERDEVRQDLGGGLLVEFPQRGMSVSMARQIRSGWTAGRERRAAHRHSQPLCDVVERAPALDPRAASDRAQPGVEVVHGRDERGVNFRLGDGADQARRDRDRCDERVQRALDGLEGGGLVLLAAECAASKGGGGTVLTFLASSRASIVLLLPCKSEMWFETA